MSETEQQGDGQRSSVEITLNAKREAQVRVKVYTGEPGADVAYARRVAVENFYEALKACGIGYDRPPVEAA